MRDGLRTTATRQVPPDPSIASAVGRHHTFETAIADLVDNSVDVGATAVLIRFLQRDGAIVGLRLIDDGRGMDAETIDGAMQFGHKRSYDEEDLGHFGLGLKAASLSQADELSVLSQRNGATPVGRRIEADDPTTLAELATDDVSGTLTNLKVDFAMPSGTVVEWARPRTFLSSDDDADRAKWLEDRIRSVMTHLGIVFHRRIAGGLRLTVDVFDLAYAESGVPRTVEAIDPFGYDGPGVEAYPAEIRFTVAGIDSVGTAHVWPAAQSGRREFRLGGRAGSLAQGFYFYKADRLLQIGGWNTLTVDRPELEYARIAVDVDDRLAEHITLNPEKAGLELDSDLKHALLGATVGVDGTFTSYLEDAQGVRREARRYTRRPVTLVPPGRGFGAEMREAFDASVHAADADPFDIRWRVERSESPLAVDLDNRTVWLNQEYRDVIAGDYGSDPDDAPLVKTLLTIIYSKYFEGSHLGHREKAELETWEQLLTAALREELAHRARDERPSDG